MPRKKQQLVPKADTEPPKRAPPPKGRPAEPKVTRRDHYLGAILTALFSKPYRQDEVPEIVKEANRLADLLLEE